MKLFFLFTGCLIVSCSNGVSPDRKEHDEQFVQIYFHFNLLDELDTFHGTYQKDLVMDGTARTTMWMTVNEQEFIATTSKKSQILTTFATLVTSMVIDRRNNDNFSSRFRVQNEKQADYFPFRIHIYREHGAIACPVETDEWSTRWSDS